MANHLLPSERKKVRKPLLWIGIASIVMTFAGLTSGYIVSRASLLPANRWLQFALPTEFYVATAFIIGASLAMIVGKIAIKNGNVSNLKKALWVALILGFGFAIIQYLGWKTLIDSGFYFTGESSNTAVSWVYVITFVHWLHVISGIIVLMVTTHQAVKNNYSKQEHQGFDLASIYWHFLDILWIYLFLFLVFIR